MHKQALPVAPSCKRDGSETFFDCFNRLLDLVAGCARDIVVLGHQEGYGFWLVL